VRAVICIRKTLPLSLLHFEYPEIGIILSLVYRHNTGYPSVVVDFFFDLAIGAGPKSESSLKIVGGGIIICISFF